ncbi:IclR family transcriptional regulator [Pseudomonas sp. BN415]|nr:IclR family transcriptional regulator [Pseudomonas sp. BN415]
MGGISGAFGSRSCSVFGTHIREARQVAETQGKDDGGTVRSVERALAIVELLGEHQELGLEELHYLTGLPKATVSRLLHTLQEQGWLYRGLCDRRYRLCSRRLFGDPTQRFSRLLVEQAAPLLLDLSESTGLVADLSYFDGDELHVMESSIPEVLRKRYPGNRLVIGLRASLFHSAMGRACLGELDSSEVQRLAQHHRISGDDLLRAHEQTHNRGFGERTEGSWEYSIRLPFLIRAVALPILSQGRLVGSIALHWPRDTGSVESVQQRHLGKLASTVSQLQHSLD